eukprot:8680104-Pyramimonas_sp.AAC.1
MRFVPDPFPPQSNQSPLASAGGASAPGRATSSFSWCPGCPLTPRSPDAPARLRAGAGKE